MSAWFMHALYTVGGFVLALGLLVFIHEYGHYSVARLCGVKVLRFSLGFGPVIWSRRRGRDQTEWTVSAIPLGGYVRMVDEREGEVPAADLPRAFNRQPLGRRAAIVAAGPAANLLLAVLLFATADMIGVPGLRPFVDAPPKASAAAVAGLQGGDEIVAVDQAAVQDWNALRMQVAGAAVDGRALHVTVQRTDGVRTEHSLDTTGALAGADGDPADALGLRVWNPSVPARLGQLLTGGAAERQGLHAGDLVLAVDGQPVQDWAAFVSRVRASPGVALHLQVQRGAAQLALTVTPERDASAQPALGRIGAAVAVDPALHRKLEVLVRRAPWPALQDGVRRTVDLCHMTVSMLWRMLTGHASTKGIGGPLQIASAAGETARLGLVPFLGFLALISVSLGVLNLLPVPVLDGGHLLYYSFELVSGKPLPDQVIATGTRIGLALLAGLMALAFFNDFNRFFSG